jgi:cytochrome P450
MATRADAPSLDDALGPILASDPEAMRDPFPVWRRLREESPVHRIGPVVLLSRYEDVKAAIRSPEMSNRFVVSGTRSAEVKGRFDERRLRIYNEISEFESLYVSRADGEQHNRLRRIAHSAFTPRRVAEMRPIIQRYTDEALARIDPSEPVDLISALAFRLPLMVICDMLGVPEEGRENIRIWSNQIGRNRGGDDTESMEIAHTAMRKLRHYVEEGLEPSRRNGTGSDLLTALLQAEEGDKLAPQEVTAMVVILLFAGHETTTNLVSIGALQLLQNRDQWERLCADPSAVGGAVEELLRYLSPVQWLVRVALTDTEFDGGVIEKGQTVFASLAAANRDPAVFEDPEALDVTRGDARNHLALGFGPHFCLGNALTRLEGAVVFETLARRFPEMELADETPEFGGNAMLRSLNGLDVVLGAPAESLS